MRLNNKNIGLGITGSFCNHSNLGEIIDKIKGEGANIIPIVTENVKKNNTRFGNAKELIKMLEEKTGNKVIDTIIKAEPLGPNNLIDIMLIVPCTGNTLAKLSNGITDNTVLMAVKSHLRNQKNLIIGISTNDGLGMSMQNIAKLYNVKNIYFIPFKQDNYTKKPNSLVYEKTKIVDTIIESLNGKQIQPLLN